MSPLAATSLILLFSQSLPEFGPYMEEKERKVAAYKASIVPLEEFPAAVHRPALQPSRPIASVQVCCGVDTYHCSSVATKHHNTTQISRESVISKSDGPS